MPTDTSVRVRINTLTPREQEVLAAIAAGEDQPETGRRLYLTVDTIKTHRRRMFLKLGARNAAHAVAIAYQRGLLPLAPDRPRGRTAP